METTNDMEIAVIGMAGRFPNARNIHEFWENLKNGIESIPFFSKEELKESGVELEQCKHANYVNAYGILEDIEYFDALFFGYTATEAEVMDPQARIFHECAWSALEDAGYDSFSYEGFIGLYVGATPNIEWTARALTAKENNQIANFAAQHLHQKDYLSLQVSYKLNLTGPSFSLNTACSTSLVAVHVASQALLSGECDMALAGGVTVSNLSKSGYMYQPGMVLSPDGHCRSFDARAQGTVGGNGAGVVLLKRLEDAIQDNDHIYAVLKSSVINNDGVRKAGFTAVSVEGQAEVIRMAQKLSGVNPETISYVETHGSATELGDPVEIEALKLAFDTGKKEYCAIGSVKTNIGHADCASGAAGFIKAVLTLYYKLIPPSLHFETPNPKIDFENSPFYVNTQLKQWQNNGSPLRAGVSSFGIGGTNGHVVLEEWSGDILANEERRESGTRRVCELIPLSARTRTALDKMTRNLAEYFQKNPGIDLSGAAYTLQTGRKTFEYRRLVTCSTATEAGEKLSSNDPRKVYTFLAKNESRFIVFMFPGLGSQYPDMGLELYREEPLFREEMDRCFDILKPFGYDIKEVLYPSLSGQDGSDLAGINRIEVAQLIIFIFEYALSKLLMKWGIQPDAMIGYSFGEFTAACISGVLSLADTLTAIVKRGNLIGTTPAGAMLSVPAAEEDLKSFLNDELSIAINNGSACIAAGTVQAIAEFEEQMKKKKLLCMRLSAAKAIHSPLMNPILKPFEEHLRGVRFNEPQIPYISNVTGDWITPEDAVDPSYLVRHLRETVRFSEGINELLRDPNSQFIEIGPGRDLSTLVKRFVDEKSRQKVINLVRPEQKKDSDVDYLANKLGQLWLYGVNIDWNIFYPGDEGKPRRLSLPTYPFEKKRFWIEGYSSRLLDANQPAGPGSKGYKSREKPAEKEVRDFPKDGEVPGELHERPHVNTPYVPPINDTQRKLVAIWQDFFGIEQVGIHDDFFELGGDSLKAMNVSISIQKELNIGIPVTEFFERHTVERLAEYVINAAGSPDDIPNDPTEKKEYFPLTFSQKSLYVQQQADQNSVSYNLPGALLLEGDLDKDRLKKIFSRLIARHEGFRKSIEFVAAEPVQKINEDVDWEIEYFETGEAGADKIVQDFSKPFDLTKAPFLRIGLVKTGESRHILVLDMHHIITDGVSINIFIKDFSALYAGRELQPLRLQYKDYAGWLETAPMQDLLKKQEEYWLDVFSKKVRVLDMPIDFPRAASLQNLEGEQLSFELDTDTLKKLRKMIREKEVTLYIMLLATYNILLSKYTEQEDIVVGTPISVRPHADLENIMGMFVNMLPMRNYPHSSKTFSRFIAEVKENSINAFKNQHYQFGMLTNKLKLTQNPNRNPLFDTTMTVFSMDSVGIDLEGLRLSPYPLKELPTPFELVWEIVDVRDDINIRLRYSNELYKRETIDRLWEHYAEIIKKVVEDEDIKLIDIELSSSGREIETPQPAGDLDSEIEFDF